MAVCATSSVLRKSCKKFDRKFIKVKGRVFRAFSDKIVPEKRPCACSETNHKVGYQHVQEREDNYQREINQVDREESEVHRITKFLNS